MRKIGVLVRGRDKNVINLRMKLFKGNGVKRNAKKGRNSSTARILHQEKKRNVNGVHLINFY